MYPALRQLVTAFRLRSDVCVQTDAVGLGRAPRVTLEHWFRGGLSGSARRRRAAGKLPIVCPTTRRATGRASASFDATPEEVDQLMHDDPRVRAGLFTDELHPVRSFPGSSLP